MNTKNILTLLYLGFSCVLYIGCSSMSNLPEKENVKVSREKPSDKECKSLGKVEGRTNKINGTQEDALADLQNEAAHKGANYLMVEQYSANGQSVTGIAYRCE